MRGKPVLQAFDTASAADSPSAAADSHHPSCTIRWTDPQSSWRPCRDATCGSPVEPDRTGGRPGCIGGGRRPQPRGPAHSASRERRLSSTPEDPDDLPQPGSTQPTRRASLPRPRRPPLWRGGVGGAVVSGGVRDACLEPVSRHAAWLARGFPGLSTTPCWIGFVSATTTAPSLSQPRAPCRRLFCRNPRRDDGRYHAAAWPRAV